MSEPLPTPAWAASLRDILGAPFAEVGERELLGLIEAGVREDVSLDFKAAHYGSSDAQKRELAADLAALANDRGGAIVVGIRDEDDVAVELTPVAVDEKEEGRLRQVAAANIAPHLAFDVHVLESAQGEGQGYYLLVVPPSSLRPHAVRKNNDLRYPRRDGSTTRWLAEAEVADMYRDRFAAAGGQVERVREVLDEGLAPFHTELDTAYLALALVPTNVGQMQIDRASIEGLEEWAADDLGTQYWRGFFGSRPRAQARLRRVALASGLGYDSDIRLPYAELHTDGSGFAYDEVSYSRPDADGDKVTVLNLHLLWGVARGLRLLGRHAAKNAGAWGDVVVLARLVGEDMFLTHPAHHGMYEEAVSEIPQSGPIDAPHTLSIDGLADSDTDLLVAARIVASDLVNALGMSEIAQIDAEGRLRRRYLKVDQRLEALAEHCGVEFSDERLPPG